ncbi:MAG TPA: hypothetical protein ENI23_10190 [bacterium]|nr:hypothetical protein [bacterium]
MNDDINKLDDQVMGLLDDATEMTIGLSETDSDYNLMFIREKVTKCATYQERISDVMMKLTRVSIEVQKVAHGKKLEFIFKTNSLKDSEEYKNLPRDEKTVWLRLRLMEAQDETESWNTLRRVVSEVKEAIGERAQTLKRLDSDLRLHTKLLEMAKEEGRGATSPDAFTGSSSKEVDID